MFIIASIKNWFLSPSYPNDEEKTLRARLIDVLLVVVIIYVPVLTMVEIITGKTPPSIIIMNIGGILICLLMRHLLRRGYVQDVGSGLIFTGHSSTHALHVVQARNSSAVI